MTTEFKDPLPEHKVVISKELITTLKHALKKGKICLLYCHSCKEVKRVSVLNDIMCVRSGPLCEDCKYILIHDSKIKFVECETCIKSDITSEMTDKLKQHLGKMKNLD